MADPLGSSWARLWARLAVRGAVLVAVVFAVYELIERALLAGAPASALHALHIARGAGTAFLLATWSFLEVRRARLARDACLADEVARLEAQVRHQEKMAALGTLAAGFAHDVGNPLSSIATELELLEGEEDVARYRESLDVLRRHVDRMSRTLREMVDFARRRRDEVTDVSIADAIADSSRLVLHDPRWRAVRLDVDVPEGLPRVRMVEDHLVLVLVNLMLNAVDAMPDGGALRIEARRRGAGVEVRVSDTGQGMTRDVLERARTPLFTTKARGTGLGLSVSTGVVRSMGGDLRIDSAPGAGTTVTVSLPASGGGDA
jgi:signal transduction histidine kinase